MKAMININPSIFSMIFMDFLFFISAKIRINVESQMFFVSFLESVAY